MKIEEVRLALQALPTRFEARDIFIALDCDDWQERQRVQHIIAAMVRRGELTIAGNVKGRSRFHIYEKVEPPA